MTQQMLARPEANARPSLVLAGLAVLLLAAVLLAAGCTSDGARLSASDGALRVAFIAPPGAVGADARQGAELAAREAARAGELTGRPFELLVAEAGSGTETNRTARRLIREGAFALVGGFDEASCRALGDIARREGVLFLNVGCREDALRESPSRHTFHIEASEWMYREAAAREGAADREAGVALWHGELFRFGAEQLNQRFQRQGLTPTPRAWATWMAVKVLWESAARARSTDPETLASYLLHENTDFDGHKGQSLSFGPEDHQLRQPLYVLAPAGSGAAALEVDPMGGAQAGMSAEAWAALEGRPVAEGRHLVISNEGSGEVVVVDADRLQVISRFRVGSRPRGIHLSSDGRFAYVALSDDAPTLETDQDGIAVIDLRQGQVIRTYPAGTDPEQFALSPDGRVLYAANEDAGTATITDLQRGTVLATLVVGVEPEGVAVSPDGRWVYVTAETSNTVSVIDTRSNSVVASFLVDVRPRAAAFSPDGRRAYVSNEISGTLSVVDVPAHQVIETLELAGGSAKPVGVGVSPDSRRVYVANGHAHSISIIDAESLTVIADVQVGRRPWGIAVSPDGSRIYTANGLSNDVTVIDAASHAVVGTVRVGQRPWGVAATR